ncbi:MAG: hypothetical protein EOR30_02020 [Mesorhizobium sp.]|nr:hypothetical protein EOA78_06815 [Mesorhizobium sp. M5C.F.Cr.IN.023.01.1.1]RWF88014.1 MAG: hypothetical protein EOQ36_10455 [Mesorhizobium sp.]RWF96358.1 MAG: hypothetical protein EOQ45_04715 [Mesorhizobium sp.]RWI38675.1 MAG: hypothetical protein EOR14_21360 [Mesorhizobium sp.]RWI49803.1 MAG: hypothetical protein EOR15_09860 [Mesorhizobium sp.]
MSCRTSPPRVGRLAVIPAFANPQRCKEVAAGAAGRSPPKWGRISGRTEGGALERCRNRRHTDHPYELG